MHAICVKQDGLNLTDLDVFFKRSNIRDDDLFLQTAEVLSKAFHYSQEG